MPDPAPDGSASRFLMIPSGSCTDAEVELEALDEQLIAQLMLRVHRARDHELSRREAGLPATTLALENATLNQYASRLGQHGAVIALAVIALSRLPAPALPTARQERDRP